MHIENPKLDEAKNPNVSHESVTKELSQLLLQLILLVIIILLLARALAWGIGNYLPYRYEQQWFSGIGNAMMKNTQTDAKLQLLSTQLSKNMHLPAGAQIQIHKNLDNDDINAYATFGGNIVLMQGLLQRAPSEQAVSMVMAHEIAHVAHRDPLKAISQGALLQVLRSAIFGQQIVVDSGLILSTFSYSRKQETAADEAALDAVYAHYGSIAGAIEMFNLLKNAADKTPKKSGVPAWLSTHPDTQKRQEHLQEYAQKKGYTKRGNLLPNPWKTEQKH